MHPIQESLRRPLTLALGLALVLVTLAAGAAEPCQDGKEKIGWLGIRNFHGAHLTVDAEDYWFIQEPRISELEAPARGELRAGDVITAIDGLLITTRKAGKRLFAPEPERPVRLSVRRRDRELEVELTPVARCPEERAMYVFSGPPVAPVVPAAPAAPTAPVLAAPAPAPPAVPSPSGVPAPAAPPAAPVAPASPAAPVLAPGRLIHSRAWYGFGFECEDCRFVSRPDGRLSYHFSSPPSIFSVDPESPAEEAGLRRGDVLTHADGLPITTDEGAERLFEAEPGSAVLVTYERDGAEGQTEIRTGERPWRTGDLARRLQREIEANFASRYHDRVDVGSIVQRVVRQFQREQARFGRREHLRYAGTVSGIDVEVRGLDTVHVTVDESEGVVEIRTLDATVRLSPAPAVAKADE